MPWTFLIFASLFEIAWVASLKRIVDLRDFGAIGISLLFLLSSVTFLTLSSRTLPIGTAYAVWTGLGVVGAVSIGAFFYAEPINVSRGLCLALILVGVMGLKFSQSNSI